MYDQKRLLGSTYINAGTNEISRDEKFIVPLSFHDEKKYGYVNKSSKLCIINLFVSIVIFLYPFIGCVYE